MRMIFCFVFACLIAICAGAQVEEKYRTSGNKILNEYIVVLQDSEVGKPFGPSVKEIAEDLKTLHGGTEIRHVYAVRACVERIFSKDDSGAC